MLEWIAYELEKAKVEDAETLSEFILSALDDGFEDEPEETVADLNELLQSASDEAVVSEDALVEVVDCITKRYKRYKGGENMSPIPARQPNPGVAVGFAAADDGTPLPIAAAGGAATTDPSGQDGAGVGTDDNDDDAEDTEAAAVAAAVAEVEAYEKQILEEQEQAAAEEYQIHRQVRSLMEAIEQPIYSSIEDEEGEKAYVEEDYFAELLALDDIALEGVLMMLLDKDDGDTAEYVAPPCKYFISGKCFRYECWYSHDLSKVPCRHYAAGWCEQGDACPFGHADRMVVRLAIEALRAGFRAAPVLGDDTIQYPSADPSAAAAAAAVFDGRGNTSSDGVSTADIAAPAPDMSEHSFPSLGDESAEGGGGGGGDGDALGRDGGANADGGGLLDLASKLKVTKLQTMFPVIWNDEVLAHFVEAGCNMGDAVASLNAAHPGAYVEPPPTRKSAVRTSTFRKSKFKGSKGVGWVTTGQEVSALYSEMRQAAIETAKARNKYFQQAAQAYIRGNRSAASDLSRRGRDLGRRMKQQHKEAAAALFETRNSSAGNRLDLHGLHVAEAIAYVEHHLEQLCHEGKRQSCFIIAGAGRHSDHRHRGAQGKQARLLPAVVRYLTEAGYEFQNNDGVLEVLLA